MKRYVKVNGHQIGTYETQISFLRLAINFKV